MSHDIRTPMNAIIGFTSLAITKNIVDMMGGTITVHSVRGEGSEFIVKLRFLTTKNKKTISVIPELKGFRALVADDSMDSCSSVTKMLRSVGMRRSGPLPARKLSSVPTWQSTRMIPSRYTSLTG